MALISSSTSGNFNSGATWVGGIVPGAADEARAATGHTITITANVTCVELSNAGTGLYILNSGVTLTANCTHKSSTVNVNLLQFTAASPGAATIVGNITGASVASTTVFGCVNNTGSGTLNITGNSTGGSGSIALGVNNNSSGTIVLTGNSTGAGGSGGFGSNNNSTGSVTITGNVTGGSANAAFGSANSSTGPVTITGNVTGGSGTNAVGQNNNSTGPVTITGNVTGGSGIDARGSQNLSTGPVTIVGNVTGGSNGSAPGVNNASTGTLTISGGTYTATTVAHAVISTNASSVVRISGSFIYASNGLVPINTPKFILLTTPTLSKTRYALNGSTTYVDMFTADNGLGQAAIADVRSGTVYASGILTGTLAVPPAGSVALGVPVDAGFGLAALTPASVWDYLLSAITTSSTVGKLLKDNIDATISSRSTATTAAIADAVWDEVLTGATHNVNRSAGKRLRQIADERIIADGETISATTNTITLEPIGTLCVGQTIVVTNQDTDEKQVRFILAFDTGTDTATVDSNWCVVPTAGDKYLLTTVRDPLVTRGDHPTGTVGAEIDEMYLLQGLSTGDTLTVTPTSRTAGAISQTIGGDGTTTTTVSRD